MNEELAEAKLETEQLRQAILFQKLRPSNIHRSFIYNDGDKWICVGGLEDEKIAQDIFDEDINARVYGYGNSPERAMEDFDRAWESGDFKVEI